jgi:hypothetical protein
MEHDEDKWMNVGREWSVMIVMGDQALMVLSPSPWNSILSILNISSLGWIVVSVSCVSVNCVVVVVRKTIGPFERNGVPEDVFEGIE